MVDIGGAFEVKSVVAIHYLQQRFVVWQISVIPDLLLK